MASDTLRDSEVLMTALVLALALEKAGLEVSSASVAKISEEIGEKALQAVISERLPSLADELDELLKQATELGSLILRLSP